MKDGQVTGFTGTFDKSAGEDAVGTASFLHYSRMTNSGRIPRWPVEKRDSYEVHLSREQGDNLNKFQEWAMVHNLVPRLADKIAERDYRDFIDEVARKSESAMAYNPAPERFVHKTIERMRWEVKEAGYGDPAFPHEHETLVTATDNPLLAFQAAHYLYKKGYIEWDQFDYINHEAKAQIKHPEPDREFRIAVPGKHYVQFEKDFPQAGQLDPGIDKQWLKRLSEMSKEQVAAR